jgi:hypothetical protein
MDLPNPTNDWMVGYNNQNKAAERTRDLIAKQLTEAGVPDEYQTLPPTYDALSLENYAKQIFDNKEVPAQKLVEAVRAGDPNYQWIIDAIQRNEPVYDMAQLPLPGMSGPEAASLLASIPADKLSKMNADEALISAYPQWQKSREFPQLILAIRNGQSYPKKAVNDILREGLKPVEDVPGWYQVGTKKAVEVEGAQMRHSVGGYSTKEDYNMGGRPAFEAGTTRVYSFRPKMDKPEVTIDLADYPDGLVKINQIQGPANTNPIENKEAIFNFLDTIPNLDLNSLPRHYYGGEGFSWKDAYQEARPNRGPRALTQTSFPRNVNLLEERQAPVGENALQAFERIIRARLGLPGRPEE